MTKIRFISFTDIHVQDTNPPSRTGDYRGDMLGKLEQIGALGHKYNVDFYMCAGDVFNAKRPDRTSHQTIQKLMTLFLKYEKNIYTIEGNHDIHFDQSDTLSQQPLGDLLQSGSLKHLRNEVYEKDGFKVALYGYPFSEEPDFSELMVPNRDFADYHIAALHIYSGPKEGKLFKTRIHGYDKIAKTEHDMYVLGHYHKDQGVSNIGNQVFVNVGSVSRGDYGDENLERKPKCCLVELIKNGDGSVLVKANPIALKVKPAEEVFDLEKKQRIKVQEEDAASFAEELQKAANDDTDGEVVSIDQELENLKIEKNMVDRTKDYLRQAHELIHGTT